ncbi:DUF3859 domain-containing protein [Shewanella algicola]|uniref:DUF3859 domain-containing protein n=1 Tax=Shewanella algicola TaxID=640633 RepID=A0A9X1ZAJ7_9GAMM|nr:DUF3859 domain-containing protein [Shewanella algicola]MCL1106727.1 DUF3859 domain-containing protein [Shewanella algicola]
MSKLKADVSIIYSGIFSQWNNESDDLPRFLEATVHVPAVIDTEFGFIARIKKAKNQVLTYCIYHPDIPDDNGHIRPPFNGTVYIKENDWRFYLGDCIWAPVSNKQGNWRMTLELNGKIVADKTFKVYLPE